jgi:hypothetical protein
MFGGSLQQQKIILIYIEGRKKRLKEKSFKPGLTSARIGFLGSSFRNGFTISESGTERKKKKNLHKLFYVM